MELIQSVQQKAVRFVTFGGKQKMDKSSIHCNQDFILELAA
jgi:hypothetical protein